MKEEQEYIEFWAGIKNKYDEVQKDYLNLSDTNKHRVDTLRNMISRASTLSDILNIINNELR